MYGWYAYDPRMRANIGIRRRLAPLLDNSRAEIELAHALLLSLPGSPFLYYGDEIGMGDNIWLPDRDAVAHADAVDARPQRRLLHRRPRQALPAGRPVARLPLPLVNVESQLAQSTSLLHWVRGMLAVRKRAPRVRPRRLRGLRVRQRARCWRTCGSTDAIATPRTDPPWRALRQQPVAPPAVGHRQPARGAVGLGDPGPVRRQRLPRHRRPTARSPSPSGRATSSGCALATAPR